MPAAKKVGDQDILVPTSAYPNYASFPFENFNPVQSRVFEFYNENCNAVIAASTSAGKTVVSEMIMAYELRVKGGKAIYLAPMKALAKEKYEDWTDPKHHFHDLKICICTGDYRLSANKHKELAEADIIVLTSEMLNSRSRNMKSENNDFLKDVSVCVVDESHLLTVPGRGDHLEVGLMNLASIASVRFVLLSATMPNVAQIANWVGYVLNTKTTYLLESKYRPCPLGIHYETYDNSGSYEEQELSKIDTALEIIDRNPDDKFLIFAQTKKTGELMKQAMAKHNMNAMFHSADLDKNGRDKLETTFKSRKDDALQYLIATSTLAWGCNLPARRVLILGVHRGLTEVATYDIWQMAGRAGRPGYDPRGDVYILVPDTHEEKHRNRLKSPQLIESKLLDNIGGHYKVLAFHLVSEIHHGRIKTKEDISNWYERTLAHFQAKGLSENSLDDSILNGTVDLLLKFGAIKEENGIYKVTVVGTVSSMFYFSPFDVADLRRNFINLFKSGRENDDLWLSLALGNVDSQRMGIVSKAEREDMGSFQSRVWREFGKDTYLEPAIKGAYAYHCCLTGVNAGNVAATARTLQWDFPRLTQVLSGLDSLGCKWNKGNYFKDMQSRVLYGVTGELVKFVKLPGVGKVKAERLWSLGFRDLTDIVTKADVVRTALNMKPEKVLEIVEHAKTLMLTGEN